MRRHIPDGCPAGEKARNIKTIKRWKTAAGVSAFLAALAAVVVLAVPALTMENAKVLSCRFSPHSHTAGCYDEDGNIVCGYADFAVHTHSAGCYDGSGNLVCTLDEISEHTHTEECYEETAVLVCGQEESAGHTHGEECYPASEPQLICGLTDDETHVHTAECYAVPESAEPACGLEESAGHTHGEDCYEYRRELICGREEIVLHTHDSGCYDVNGNLICGLLEIREHIHGEDCFTQAAEPVTVSPSPVPTDALPSITDSGAAPSESPGADSGKLPQADTGGGSWATVDKPGYGDSAGAAFSLFSNALSAGAGVDFAPHISGTSIEREVDGQWTGVSSGGTITDGDTIRVTINYRIPESVVTSSNRIIYYQLPAGISLEESASGNVYIDGTDPVGVYTIGTDGLITITFNESFADGRAFTGHIGFQGTASLSDISGGGDIVFGGAGGRITVVPKEEETDIAIEKAGWYAGSSGINAVAYSITVSSENGTDGPVTVTDAFLNEHVDYDMDFPGFPLTVVDGNNLPVEYGGLTVTGSSFTLTLPKLAAGGSYTITYAAVPDLNHAEADGYMQITNRAEASDGKNEAQAQINVIVSQAMVYKEGTYNELTRQFEWSILLNQGQQNLNGLTLDDTLTCTYAGGTYEIEVSTVTLTPVENWQPVEDEALTVSLPYTFDHDTTSMYLVTYQTDLPDGIDEGESITMHNTAEIGGFYDDAIVTAEMPGELDYGVVKGLTNATGGGLVSWATLITYPESLANVEEIAYIDILVDVLRADGSAIADSHYTTPGILQESLAVQTSGQTALVYGIDYTVWAVPLSGFPDDFDSQTDYEMLLYTAFSDIQYGLDWELITQFDEGTPLAAFAVTFHQSALLKIQGQSIVITYNSQVDMGKMPAEESLMLANIAVTPGESTVAMGYYSLNPRLDKQASPTGEDGSYSDGPIEVDYNASGGTLHYRILLSGYGSESTTLTVTDTLPSGAEFLPGSVTLRNYYTGDSDGAYRVVDNTGNYYLNYTVSENEDGSSTITFNFNYRAADFEDGALFAIYYDVSVAGDPAWAEQDTLTYENIVSWGEDTDSTITTVSRTEPLLEKIGEQVLDENGEVTDTVRYYVLVNPESVDLHPDSNTITMTDTLEIPDGVTASLRLESVALYRYDAGAEGNHYCGAQIDMTAYPVQYDEDTLTITFTLPDSTACVVVYEYALDLGDYATVVEINNRVELNGAAHGSAGDEIIVQQQSSQAGVNKATLTIYKHDAENVLTLLPGARFRLERYESADGVYQWRQSSLTAHGEDGTFIVGDRGYIELNYVQYVDNSSLYNTLYRLTEVSAPDGYAISGAEYYFVWMTDGATIESTISAMQASGAVPDGFSFDTESVLFIAYNTDAYLYVPNSPTTTSITVNKLWRGTDGSPLTENLPEEVTVTLYQWVDGERSEYDTQRLTEANGWTYSWGRLPKSDADGNVFTYTVAELETDGYTTSYENNGGITNGAITIINSKDSGFTLPETGGEGALPYAAAGLLLAGAACAGWVYNRRKKRAG